ncbi:MAG TPA: prolyl oligopeptidase family serine peptidase [Thermoanaerobaculia bacterium]
MHFQRRSVRVGGRESIYQVYVSADAPAEDAPVILFLHGAGERGHDGVVQTRVGLGAAIQRRPDAFPFVVVFPQSPRGVSWVGVQLTQAVAALEQTMVEFRCDTNRQYLTGISMGGHGSWALALQQPERFAAVVPVCGWLDARIMARHADAARQLAHLPLWVFHGDADTVIPVEESRVMVEALRAAGSDVRYTEYHGVAHNSWDPAYDEPELAAWLLSQSRDARSRGATSVE